MWQRLISISLSISQVIGTDTFSFSNWATFILILWYSDMQGLFHLYLCVRARTCAFRSVYYSKFTARSSVPAVSHFTTRWSHCLALLTAEESDKDSNWLACLCDGLFSNRNYFVIKSNHVIFTPSFTFDIWESEPEYLTPSPAWIQILYH